jgi:hypothetical protein
MSYPFAPVHWTFFPNLGALVKLERLITLPEWVREAETTYAPTKARLPWGKMARFGDTPSDGKGKSLRHNANVLAVSGIEADYDKGQISFDEAVEIARKGDVQCSIETSASHTPERPRWHVFAPFSEEKMPGERTRYLNRLNGLYGNSFDPASWTLVQCFHVGRIKGNSHYRIELIEGTPIDLLDELDLIAIGKPNGAAGPQMPGAPPVPFDEPP